MAIEQQKWPPHPGVPRFARVFCYLNVVTYLFKHIFPMPYVVSNPFAQKSYLRSEMRSGYRAPKSPLILVSRDLHGVSRYLNVVGLVFKHVFQVP